MKKYSILISACIALVLSSCVENEVPVNNEPIKLNLNIPAFDTGTKAMKQGWAKGDKINIWFDGEYCSFDYDAPDLVITYNGSTWTAGPLRAGASPTEGTMYLIYEGYNDISLYNPTAQGDTYYDIGSSLTRNFGDKLYFCTPLIVIGASSRDRDDIGIPYTFKDNTLESTTAPTWWFYTQFKVLVKGLEASEAKNYLLQICNPDFVKQTDGSGNQYPSTIKGFMLYESEAGRTRRFNDSPRDGITGGVPDTDGVAFYYGQVRGWTKKESVDESNITFTLYKFNSSSIETGFPKALTIKRNLSGDNGINQDDYNHFYEGISVTYNSNKWTTVEAE